MCNVTEREEYRQIDAVRGDTVIMACNTNQSYQAQWTRNATFDGFSYVYFKGTIMGRHNIMQRFSVVNASTGDHSLKMENVLSSDSGWYDCYETDGRRLAGYYLVAKGKLLVARETTKIRHHYIYGTFYSSRATFLT